MKMEGEPNPFATRESLKSIFDCGSLCCQLKRIGDTAKIKHLLLPSTKFVDKISQYFKVKKEENRCRTSSFLKILINGQNRFLNDLK